MGNRFLTTLTGASNKIYQASNIDFGDNFSVYHEFSLTSGTNYAQVILGQGGDAPNRSFFLRWSGGNLTWFISEDGSAFATPIASFACATGVRHKIWLTKSGSDYTINFNGTELTGTGFSGSVFSATGSFKVGGKDAFTEIMSGQNYATSIVIDGTEVHRWQYNNDGSGNEESDLVGSNPLDRGTLSAGQTEAFTRNTSGATFSYDNAGATVVIPDAFTPEYAVIFQGGQSNEVGWISQVGAGVDDDYENAIGCLQYGFSAQDLSVAENPLDHQNGNAGTMGLWLELVKHVVDNALHPVDKELLIVPAAKGSTSIADWQKGQSAYNGATQRLNEAMAINASNELMMVSWLQGENDADLGTTQPAFVSACEQMRSDMIADTAIALTTPWVCAEILGSATPANVAVINSGLAEWCNNNSKMRLVATSDLNLVDVYHYDAASLRTIGQRKGEELALLSGGASFQITITGGVPDGSYLTVLQNRNTGTVVYDGQLTYSSGVATALIDATSGDVIKGWMDGGETPPIGTRIYGVIA